MGTLHYADWSVEFDDRLLTHLQIVIVHKFRRGEPFLMSWIDGTAVGSGRSAIWLAPDARISFRFNGSRVPTVDRAWVQRLLESASSPTGLIVADEHGAPITGDRKHSSLRVPRPTPRR